MSFCGFEACSLGSRPSFLPSRPYFRVCVLVAVNLSTETSLYASGPLARSASPVVRGVETAAIGPQPQTPLPWGAVAPRIPSFLVWGRRPRIPSPLALGAAAPPDPPLYFGGAALPNPLDPPPRACRPQDLPLYFWAGAPQTPSSPLGLCSPRTGSRPDEYKRSQSCHTQPH